MASFISFLLRAHTFLSFIRQNITVFCKIPSNTLNRKLKINIAFVAQRICMCQIDQFNQEIKRRKDVKWKIKCCGVVVVLSRGVLFKSSKFCWKNSNCISSFAWFRRYTLVIFAHATRATHDYLHMNKICSCLCHT